MPKEICWRVGIDGNDAATCRDLRLVVLLNGLYARFMIWRAGRKGRPVLLASGSRESRAAAMRAAETVARRLMTRPLAPRRPMLVVQA